MMRRIFAITIPAILMAGLAYSQFLCLAHFGWMMMSDLSHPVTQVGSGATFAMSQSPKLDAYFTHSQAAPMSGTLAISLSVATTGTPVFQQAPDPSNTCLVAPSAHLIISSADYVDGNNYHRWWATGTNYVLAAGSATLSAPLTPANWVDVIGEAGDSSAPATVGFNSVLAAPTYIGVTFGGGCFYGHGVTIASGGTAQFNLLSYSITP